jgi:hypothetical protein
MPLVIAALLGLSALVVVVVPLFAPGHASAESDNVPAATLADRERAARAALHDVEFDYQLGNLADDDYQSLRERYTRRALAALKGRYDRERAMDEAIETQVRALRAAGSNGSSVAGKRTNSGKAKPAPGQRAHRRPSGQPTQNGRADGHRPGRA